MIGMYDLARQESVVGSVHPRLDNVRAEFRPTDKLGLLT